MNSAAKKLLVDQTNQKIQSGFLPQESTNCLCGGTDETLIGLNDWLGLTARVVLCPSCGLIRLNPRLTAQGYGEFYGSDEYRRLHGGDDFLETTEQRFKSREGRHIFEFVSPFFRGTRAPHVLEVGAAAGWNLVKFREIGCPVKGYDLSPAMVSFGQSKGLDIKLGSVEKALASDAHWADLIIFNHVIEHLTDLPQVFAAIKSRAKKDCLVYIGVPNIENFSVGQLQLAHTYYFSKPTLIHYLQKFGFSLLQFDSAQEIHMQGVFCISEGEESPNSLEGEAKRLLRKIRHAQRMSKIGSLLDRLGLKKFIRSLVSK